ncbi:MAG: PASTA domain-containing protein [bacterium]
MDKGGVKDPFGSLITWGWRLLGVLIVWGAIAAVINFVVMPIYTRQGTEIRVPDVRGMMISKARQEFGRRGFKLVVDDQRFDASQPPGMILDQFPAPGGWTKRGRRIHLAVSAGTATAVVPLVIGLPRDDAVFKLQGLGLKVDSIAYAFSDTTFEGLVIAQQPPQDTVVEKLSKATVTVSLGTPPDRYVVPNVLNLPEEQAKYLILKAGLVVGEVERDRYTGRRQGAVMIQLPVAGTAVAVGDTVNLTVNSR